MSSSHWWTPGAASLLSSRCSPGSPTRWSSAPRRLSCVLPSLLEFLRGSVVVGHNVRFDLSFLDAALTDNGYEPLANTVIDTLALARRLVRPDVPNCKLRTLATALRLEHLPSHRALDDVRATADLLHRLIEHATGYDVFVLGDLVDLMARPTIRAARVSEAG